MKVHIADDNKFFSDYLSMVLPCIYGVESVHVEKYSELTDDSLRRTGADVLVVDNSLPNDVDLESIARLRVNFPDLVIVIYAWQKYDERRERCIEAGADHVFCKSSGTEYVRYVIRDLAGQQETKKAPTEVLKLRKELPQPVVVAAKPTVKDAADAKQGDLPAFCKFWSKQKGLSIGN
ncbi:MAG: two-component system response regulator YesN [Kiritimatiellia bacterium]|jgi:two-component system response regulator YesN